MDVLLAQGAAACGRAIHARAISPVELTKAVIANIEALDSTLHTYLLPLPEQALASARRLEREIMQGRARSGLHGVPYAVKDIFHARGHRTSAASRLTEGHVADHDAATIERLDAAGGIFIGKLNTWEFGTGNGGEYFDLPFPPARNPWDAERFPGGSSTGAGAAIASMQALLALGTDTGGSVRFPAAATGTQGLKTTYGRISRYGILPNCWSLDAPGPLGWTVEDCALALSVLAGHDRRDPGCAAMPVGDYLGGLQDGLRGLRIGWLADEDPVLGHMDEAVMTRLAQAKAVFAAEGAILVPFSLPVPVSEYRQANMLINWSESYSIHEHAFLHHSDRMGRALREKMMSGFVVRAADYLAAQRRRRELAAATEAALHGVDALLLPMTYHVSPRFADDADMRAFTREAVTSLFSLTGHPAMSICSGYDQAGLPTSLQLAAKWWDEATLLRVARGYERATPWRARRPAMMGATYGS